MHGLKKFTVTKMRFMHKKFTVALLLFVLAFSGSFARNSEKQSSYRFTIDLNNVSDDKIHIELLTPSITQKTIAYHLPKIVPGTYSEDDYGR